MYKIDLCIKESKCLFQEIVMYVTYSYERLLVITPIASTVNFTSISIVQNFEKKLKSKDMKRAKEYDCDRDRKYDRNIDRVNWKNRTKNVIALIVSFFYNYKI